MPNDHAQKYCSVCGKGNARQLIDFGKQVVCHHFLRDPKDDFYAHDLAVGQCDSCGTVQLMNPMPLEQLKPRYDWLTCTEPEAHLDRLVETIAQLPGITKDSKICGISFKDDSTLGRLKKLGFKNIWRADPVRELGIPDPKARIESVQEYFSAESAERLIKIHGKADIFIARHIIEHAHHFRRFLELSKQLLNPQGYVVFEIPDCERAFEKCDYTTMWEEHAIYFTKETFRSCFHLNGLSLVHFEHIPYSIEDSYVGIAKIDKAGDMPAVKKSDLSQEISRARKFADEYQNKKNKIQEFLKDYRQKKGKIALFGGGHMSCVFLNLFDLKNCVEFVVDDNPHMRGLFMPGSRLPILESKAIYDDGVKLCILTLSTSSEEKVIKNNQGFLEKGGAFASVFPGSRWALNLNGRI